MCSRPLSGPPTRVCRGFGNPPSDGGYRNPSSRVEPTAREVSVQESEDVAFLCACAPLIRNVVGQSPLLEVRGTAVTRCNVPGAIRGTPQGQISVFIAIKIEWQWNIAE